MKQEWTLTATFKGELLEDKTHGFFRFILENIQMWPMTLTVNH